MGTRMETGPTGAHILFEEARDKLNAVIEISDALDERGNPMREEYYLSDAPSRAFQEHRGVVEQLYTASRLARTSAGSGVTQAESPDGSSTYADGSSPTDDAQQFWEIIQARTQLLTILLSLHSVRVDSKIWTDFIQIDDASRGSLTGLSDSQLPLDKESLSSRLSPYDGRSPRQCPNLQEDFSSRQLLVCAVRLEENKQKDRSAYSDRGNHLPLLRKILIGKGSSGTVYRVKFAPGHFTAYEGKELAMKQFSGNVADTVYVREWAQSEKLQLIDLSHASVLTACAALKLEIGALLFFPLADFNLWQYMNMEKPEGPKDFDEKLLWLHQLSKVAGALAFLHREGIYHGDVKSENILVSLLPTGFLKLQITDFGIMSGGDQRDITRVLARSTKLTPARPHSLGDDCHNRAPESYGSCTRSTPTKRDVWGFGTVLSEVLAWFSLGKQSLDSFEHKRAEGSDNDQYFQLRRRKRHRFWKADVERFELRERVVKWFETHTARPFDPDTQFLHVRIWDLLQKILECEPDDRLEADKVREDLVSIGSKKSDELEILRRRSSRRETSSSSLGMNADRSLGVNELGIISGCLDHAIRDCDLPVVDLLRLHLGDNACVIHRAVDSRNFTFLDQLANRNAESNSALCRDLNQPDAAGRYPLLTAISDNTTDVRFELVRQLIRLGADVNISDADGETPLHYASNVAVHSIVKALLDAEARPSEEDEGGVTPLHLCASVVSSDIDREPEACVSELLGHGANKKAKDKAGRYPLNYALDGKSYMSSERWAIIRVLCTGTLREQYVFDVFNELPPHIQQRCMDMWHECNPDV
ncbi:hypothetical protein Q7P37_011648 [Cladosporium fusiforme]